MTTLTIQPGESWQQRAEQAAAGDSLVLAAGDHGKQVLTIDKALGFDGADGARAQLVDLQNAGQLTFFGIPIRRHFVQGACHSILFAECDFGGTPEAPAMNAQSQVKKYDQAQAGQPVGITYDSCDFHDVRRSDKTVHTEGLQILNGAQIALRRCRFWNCDGTGDLGVTPLSLIDGLVIEDCSFDDGGDTGYGIQIGGKIKDLVCRRNSGNAPGGVFFSDSEVAGPYLFEANTWKEGYTLRNSPAGKIASFVDAPAPPPPPPPPPPPEPTDLELARVAEMELAAMWDCAQRATSTYAYWLKRSQLPPDKGGYPDVTQTWWWKARQHKDAALEALGRIVA